MTLLITEAYSASNIGDLELVRRSIEIAQKKYPNRPSVCLAVDPGSFGDMFPDVRFVTPIFSRLKYLKSKGPARLGLAASWAATIAALSLTGLLPRSAARACAAKLAAAKIVDPAIRFYLEAPNVVAVGGGYLGDQYVKHTVLTMWTWWWAGRVGCAVETMPLSVEIEKPALRNLAKATRHVQWRVRDQSSADALAKADVPHVLLPDLAFLNVASEAARPREPREGVMVALVGSDYLSPDESQTLSAGLAGALVNNYPDVPVTLLSMHRPVAGTHVGGDQAASDALIDVLAKSGKAASKVNAEVYDDVCNLCAGSDAVISARMHAGIAALCGGAKVALLAYEEKHFALMRDLGLSEFVVDIRASADQIEQMVSRLKAADRSVFIAAAKTYYTKVSEALLNG
ncbi:MAG TPA: polysaccharide pyruvyl transferase family protein [Caulobacter sp.]|nr:polysaccharide pyruvyl transferase family protein [Caulobacter sp.]